MLNVTGVENYKGVIQKGDNYTIVEEGYDYYRLKNRTYIPKFTVGPVIEDDDPQEYEPSYWEIENDYDLKRGKANEKATGMYDKSGKRIKRKVKPR